MSVLSGMKVINSNGKTPVNKPTGNKPQNTGSDDIVVTSSSLDRPDNIIFEENQNLADVQSDFNKGIRETTEQGIKDFEDLYQGVRRTPGTDLDEKYNQNFIKEGRYGNLNNKGFDETLRLSRQADAYNNEPVEKMHLGISYNPSAGQGVGGFETTGYERPNIETQEMRQMRANERLDEMQRGLDVQLQHDITKLPYDAFVKALDKKFDIRVSEADARRTFEQIRAVDRANQRLMKDQEDFMKRYGAKFGMKLGQIMMELAKTNTLQAMVFSNYVLGYPAFTVQEYYTYKFLDPYIQKIASRISQIEDPQSQIQQWQNFLSGLSGMMSSNELSKVQEAYQNKIPSVKSRKILRSAGS